MDPRLGNEDWEEDGETIAHEEVKLPTRYKVLLHNDDYTTMEFVIEVLQKIFRKGSQDAERIMMEIHQRGHGICGVFSFDVAETKVAQVMEFAKESGHPLLCSMEEE